MADSIIQVPTDGSGRKLDSEQVTVGANTVERQRIRQAPGNTATLANVSGSATSVSLRSSTAARVGLLAFNDSTASLFLKYGATASATSFTVKIPPGGYWEMPQPVYTGAIDGIWDAANGAVRLTEMT